MLQVFGIDTAARCLHSSADMQGVIDYAAGQASSCHVRYRITVVSVAERHKLQPPCYAFLDQKHCHGKTIAIKNQHRIPPVPHRRATVKVATLKESMNKYLEDLMVRDTLDTEIIC